MSRPCPRVGTNRNRPTDVRRAAVTAVILSLPRDKSGHEKKFPSQPAETGGRRIANCPCQALRCQAWARSTKWTCLQIMGARDIANVDRSTCFQGSGRFRSDAGPPDPRRPAVRNAPPDGDGELRRCYRSWRMTSFAAIDFETADRHSDSACSVGVVLVKDDRIEERFHRLIRPPRKKFVFTHIHGLTWNHVRDSPSFGDLWPELRRLLDRADFLVAHNASFDSRVLRACCRRADISPPRYKFRCTVSMARNKWNLRSARLPIVCDHLGIALNHHDALSDAEACAKIAMRALG